MILRPPRYTPFPYTPLSRSPPPWPSLGPRSLRAPGRRSYAARRGRSLSNSGGPAVEGGLVLDHHAGPHRGVDRKSTRLNSSHSYISYAVFCLKKKRTPALMERFTTRLSPSSRIRPD